MLKVNLIVKLLELQKAQDSEFRVPTSFLMKRASDFHLQDLDDRSDWVLRRGPDYKDGRETWTCYSQSREEYLSKDGHSYVYSAKNGWGDENAIENPNMAFVFDSRDAALAALLLYFRQHPDDNLQAALESKGLL